MNAQKNDSVYIYKFHYYETDKKGEKTKDYLIERNTRFGFCVFHALTPKTKCSMVLSDEMYDYVFNKLLPLGMMKNDLSSIGIEDDVKKKIWNFYMFLNSEGSNSYYINVREYLANKEKIMSGNDESFKSLIKGVDEVLVYLDKQISSFQKLFPDPVLTYYYNSVGPNGLAGIFRDSNGKEWDQTSDVAYTVSLNGVTMWNYSWEAIDRCDISLSENKSLVYEVINKASEKIKFEKYVEPKFREFVTDAAPPCYTVVMSDGKRMSTSDDNDYKYNAEEMPKQRYSVEGHYYVNNVIDNYTNFNELTEKRYKNIPRKYK